MAPNLRLAGELETARAELERARTELAAAREAPAGETENPRAELENARAELAAAREASAKAGNDADQESDELEAVRAELMAAQEVGGAAACSLFRVTHSLIAPMVTTARDSVITMEAAPVLVCCFRRWRWREVERQHDLTFFLPIFALLSV